MSSDKIKVKYDVSVGVNLVADAVLIKMRREGKDGFEATVKIPVGDEVSSKDFALAVKALYEASLSFHHRVYDKLREEMEALNRGKGDVPPLLGKDQRGS